MARDDYITDEALISELMKLASVVLGKSKLRDGFIRSLPKDAKIIARQIGQEIDAGTAEVIKDTQKRTEKLAQELLQQAYIELVKKHLAVIERHRADLPEEIYEIFKTAVVASAKKTYNATNHLSERAD